MSKFSVITVCKNAEATLEGTISSVLSQTYKNIEYLVIDGGSTDGTLNILKRYETQFSYITSEADQGVYNAMNKGIQRATGDFIFFANADDHLIDPQVFENFADTIAAHPEVDLIYGDHQACYTSGDRGFHAPVSPDQMLDEIIGIGDRQLLQPATFFKTTTFQRIGLFNENYKIAADYDWFLRYFSDPRSRPYYHPQPVVVYHHGGLSNNIQALFTEIFRIQALSPVCQTSDAIALRLERMQKNFMDKYDLLERTNQLSLQRLRDIQFLEQELQNSNALSLKRLQHIEDLEARLHHLEPSRPPHPQPLGLKKILRTVKNWLR